MFWRFIETFNKCVEFLAVIESFVEFLSEFFVEKSVEIFASFNPSFDTITTVNNALSGEKALWQKLFQTTPIECTFNVCRIE